MRIRRARADDVPGMLELKRSLTFDGSVEGGFLLGSDATGYHERLRDGLTWVLVEDDVVHGLAVVLADETFRESEIWQRRDAVEWSEEASALFSSRLGYYDQLGVRCGSSARWGAALALAAAADLMRHVDHLVTTTVAAPVCNLAAVPLIERIGGRKIGHIDEHYEDFGPLVSDLWLVHGSAFAERMSKPRTRAEAWLIERAMEALEA